MDKSMLAIAISVVSLLVSLLVAFHNWSYDRTTVRFTSRNHYTNALFDIDRQLVNRPELWAIYDDHPMAAKRSMDPEAVARRDAFIYLHFNLFETVYNDYHKVLQRTQTDEQYWRSWDSWIHYFFRTSSEARNLFYNAECQDIFFGDFVLYAKTVIREVAPEATALPSPRGSPCTGSPR